jgi:GTP-binding protein HflX
LQGNDEILGGDGDGPRQRALVLHPRPPARGQHARTEDAHIQARTEEGRLAEAVGLSQAIALEVVDAAIVPLRRTSPATLMGSGKIASIGEQIADAKIDLVIVDAALSPVQQRNLERAWKCKVIDRTGLILEIFGDRAQTKEGSLQVELAALTYQRSRRRAEALARDRADGRVEARGGRAEGVERRRQEVARRPRSRVRSGHESLPGPGHRGARHPVQEGRSPHPGGDEPDAR